MLRPHFTPIVYTPHLAPDASVDLCISNPQKRKSDQIPLLSSHLHEVANDNITLGLSHTALQLPTRAFELIFHNATVVYYWYFNKHKRL